MRALDQVVDYLRKTKRFIAIQDFDRAVDAACNVVKNIFEDAPTLGVDLDGTIDEAPEFFRVLTKVWPGAVIVITMRDDRDKAIRDAESFGVHFDDLVLVRRFEDKAAVIERRGVDVYVDDQDEMLLHIPEGVTVLKIRNGGNYDYALRKWLFSDQTGRML